MRKEPIFNLKAVLQQTGLKPDTLRAWERRYGLPAPERSAGGHRLYSQRDIETIKWLMARQREGLSISRAVEQWEQLKAEGRNPLQAPMPIATQAGPVLAPRVSGGTVTQLRHQWVGACLAYDEQRTREVLNEAFALYAPETVVVEVLQRAVAQIGEGWYRGDVTVQQEHFCSGLVIRRLDALVMAAPPPNRPGRLLVACPPQEQHVIAPLLLTLLLRRRGWDVVYLGANVPVERLEATVAVIQPQLVIMAAQLLHTAATLGKAARALQQVGIPLAYGGLVFNLLPALQKRIPGHSLGNEIEAAPQVVESLMTAPRLVPLAGTVPDRYDRALKDFQERQGLIESRVVQLLSWAGFMHNHVALANYELGLNIGAALALGDMGFLGADIDWVTGLLKNYQMPAEALYSFLGAYHQAASEHLDKHGHPVVSWLAELLIGDRPD